MLRFIFSVFCLILCWFIFYLGFKDFKITDDQCVIFSFFLAIVATLLFYIADTLNDIYNKLK